ncbi:hypothetical protein GGD83_004199 [Rhodoblastus sphagnicola]|nr:hypothetical protein [Rhodoblastus sphagnicola]
MGIFLARGLAFQRGAIVFDGFNPMIVENIARQL